MRRRRKNPAIGKSIGSAVGVAAGILATEFIPGMLGLSGPLPVAAVGLATGLAARAINPNFGNDVLIGGIAIAVVSFLKTQLNLGTGLSFYINNGFPLPTTGSGPYLLNAGYSGSAPQMNGGM